MTAILDFRYRKYIPYVFSSPFARWRLRCWAWLMYSISWL